MPETPEVTLLGDYEDPETYDFECSLAFDLKAVHIERARLWKSKDLSAEFFGNFWNSLLDLEELKPRLHYICAELLENAVYHGSDSNYRIMVHLCLKKDEMLVYVTNRDKIERVDKFKEFVAQLLGTENIQKLFVEKIREARKAKERKSQVGLITLIKDRGAKLAWRLEEHPEFFRVTTMARISLRKKVCT